MLRPINAVVLPMIACTDYNDILQEDMVGISPRLQSISYGSADLVLRDHIPSDQGLARGYK